MLGINIDAVYTEILGKMDEPWLAHGYGAPFGLSISALCATAIVNTHTSVIKRSNCKPLR